MILLFTAQTWLLYGPYTRLPLSQAIHAISNAPTYAVGITKSISHSSSLAASPVNADPFNRIRRSYPTKPSR